MQEKTASQLQLLSVSHGVNHVYQLLTPVIIPEITREYGLSNTSAGLLVACYAVSYALLPVLAGYLAQRFGRRKILTIGFVVSALSFLAVAFTNNVTVLGVLFFTAGAGGSTYHPNGTPILAEVYPTGRGRALGLHQTGGVIGAIVGPLAAALLVQAFTWKPAVALLAIPGLVLAAVLWFHISPNQPLKKPASTQPARRFTLAKLKVLGPALFLIVAVAIYGLGQRGTDSFGNQYFVIGRGIEFAEATFLFISLRVAGLVSAPLFGRLSDKYNRKKVLVTLVIVESISLYAVTVTPTALVAVPCIIFGFAAFGLLGVGEALLADITPEGQRSMIFGLNYSASFSSSIYLPPSLGWVADNINFNAGFMLLSAIMPLSILFILKIKNGSAPHHQNDKNQI